MTVNKALTQLARAGLAGAHAWSSSGAIVGALPVTHVRLNYPAQGRELVARFSPSQA